MDYLFSSAIDLIGPRALLLNLEYYLALFLASSTAAPLACLSAAVLLATSKVNPPIVMLSLADSCVMIMPIWLGFSRLLRVIANDCEALCPERV